MYNSLRSQDILTIKESSRKERKKDCLEINIIVGKVTQVQKTLHKVTLLTRIWHRSDNKTKSNDKI